MKVFKNFFYVFCGIFLGRLFNFLSSVLIARIAGAESIGEYTLFMAVFVISSESTSVIDTALTKFCLKQYCNRNEALKCAFLTKFLYLITFVLIFLLINYLFLDQISEYWSLIFGAGISGCLFGFFMINIAWNQLNFKYLKVGISQFLFQFSCFILIAFGLYGGLYESKYLIGIYLVVVAVFFFASIRTHIDSLKPKISIPFFKEFLSTSLILISAAIVNQLSNRLDVFFITGFLDKTELGYYGAALRATAIMTLFTAATRIVLLPNAPGASINLKKRKGYVLKASVIIAIQFILLIVMAIFAKELIVLLYGESYMASVNILRVLIFQVLIGSAVIPVQLLIQVGPQPIASFKINIKKMLFGIVCSLILIPSLGLIGAAMVGGLTNVYLLYSFVLIQKKIDFKEKEAHKIHS